MAADAEGLTERVAHVEATVEQMDNRLATVEQDIRALRDETRELRQEIRYYFVGLFVALSALISVFQFLM